MADDLVQRLREHADRVAGGGPGDATYDPETLALEHEAADEIERLRAEVAELVQVLSETATAHDDLACEHEAAVDADAAARCRAVLTKHQGVLGDE